MIHREEIVAAAPTLVDAGVNGVELVARLTRVEQGARVVRRIGGRADPHAPSSTQVSRIGEDPSPASYTAIVA
jgi:hypothetical protein